MPVFLLSSACKRVEDQLEPGGKLRRIAIRICDAAEARALAWVMIGNGFTG